MIFVATTEAEARASVALRRKLLGPPRRGEPVNGGRHGPVPEAWDEEGPVPAGWSGAAGPIQVDGAWEVELANAESALESAASQLTVQERAQVAQMIAAARERLPPEVPNDRITPRTR